MREVLMCLGQTQIHPSDMMCKQQHFFFQTQCSYYFK